MKYSKSKQIGDQGEHLAAFRFIGLFGWPFRLQTIDTGVDAEYEITNEDDETLGMIAKVQIKSTAAAFKPGSNVCYVDQEHIDYWKDFSVPILFFYVSLKSDEILWTCIESATDYSTSVSGDGQKVELHYPNSLLSSQDEARLIQIARRTTDPVFQSLLQAEEDSRHLSHLRHDSLEDGNYLLELESRMRRLQQLFDRDANAKQDPYIGSRISAIWSRIYATNRRLDRLADADDDRRDG